MIMVGEIVDEFIADLARPLERHPVLNREDRVMLDPRMWHLIHERDGNRCWVCGCGVAKGAGEIDHLVPRSSFLPDEMSLADKSWNLRLACVTCNQRKSNYAYKVLPRTFGVTSRCVECSTGADLTESALRAYCGVCGLTSWVPDESWVM